MPVPPQEENSSSKGSKRQPRMTRPGFSINPSMSIYAHHQSFKSNTTRIQTARDQRTGGREGCDPEAPKMEGKKTPRRCSKLPRTFWVPDHLTSQKKWSSRQQSRFSRSLLGPDVEVCHDLFLLDHGFVKTENQNDLEKNSSIYEVILHSHREEQGPWVCARTGGPCTGTEALRRKAFWNPRSAKPKRQCSAGGGGVVASVQVRYMTSHNSRWVGETASKAPTHEQNTYNFSTKPGMKSTTLEQSLKREIPRRC